MNDKNPTRYAIPLLSTPVRLGVAAVAACFVSFPALSNPVNPTVVNGTASFNQAGNMLTVTNSNGAIINWDKFSIKVGETTHFAQVSASSSVLNRVLANDPTTIYGTLSSNGRVWLVNPAGIMVGAGGRVDVAGFVASTLNISNENFLAGRNLFVNDGTAQNVVNQGEIKTPSGGSVYLVASNVSNEGIITTPKGETILAAGQTVSLIDSATPGVKVDITGAAGYATNLGTITAEAGRIGIAGVIVRNSGNLNASSVVSDGGRIFLKATGDTLVEGGRLEATSSSGKGGQVDVLGDRVAVTNDAQIDVSGATGGGKIHVGGDYQGKNLDVQNAGITYFGKDAVLMADATGTGDGGSVIIWADDTTRAYGHIFARGGANGGNGGFVETSGHNYLDVAGARVTTLAPMGNTGNWLLDPGDVTIVHSVTPVNAALTVSGPTSTISDYDIVAALTGTTVTIATSAGSGGFGDITFNSTVGAPIVITSATTPNTLNFNADRNIVFSGGNSTTFVAGSTGSLAIGLNATGNVQTLSGSSVVLTSGGGNVSAWLPAGKTWENYGGLSISSNAAVHLGAGATFHNNSSGVANIAGTTGYAFWSSPSDDGIVSNDGLVSVTVGTAFEAAFNQSASGSLSVNGGSVLGLQNAQAIQGGINLNGTSQLRVNEYHGVAASFSNVTFNPSGGTLYVGGSVGGTPTASFSNVDAGSVVLNVGLSTLHGVVNIVGNTDFLTIAWPNSISSLNINNAVLGVNSAFTTAGIPAGGLTYTGNVGIVSTGTLTISNSLTAPGNLLLASGWDGTFAGLSNPTVAGGMGTTVNAGINAAGILDMRAASGGIAVNGAFISGGGASQSISSLGAITVTGNASGAAALNYSGTGIQTVSGANISVLGNSSAGSSRSGMMSAMTGSQVITATGTLSVTGGGIGTDFNNAAEIMAGGSQTFNLGGNLTLMGGGGGYNNGAFIQAGQSGGAATQTFNFTGGGANSVTLTGGSSSLGGGFGPSGCGAACTPYVSNSGAWIQNQGSGLQKLDFQAGTTNTLNLNGGSAGGGNDASINSNGSQWVGGVSRPAITLLGGPSGGKVIASGGKDYYMDNSAGLSADGTQVVQASSISMQSGSATYGGAFMGGTLGTSITVTGALSMTANGPAPASHNDSASNPLNEIFAHATPVAIGDKVGTSVSINAAGVSLNATTANNLYGGSPVLIGSLYGTANVSIVTTGAIGITATSSPLYGSSVMIGSRALVGGTVVLNSGTSSLSLDQSYVGSGYGMGDSVSLIGGALGLGQATGGRIAAHLLTASYGGTGTLSLPGNNEVDFAVLSAPTGDLNYNSNRSFHLVSATAGAVPGVGITTTPGSAGKIFIGSITTTGNRNVAVNADGGIYDDNGSGVTNISTGSGNITLTSAGGTLGDLAISTDTATTGALTATVSGGYGGISVRNSGAASSVTIADHGSAGNRVAFQQTGSDLVMATGTHSFTVDNGGDLAIFAGGNMVSNSGGPSILLANPGSSVLMGANGNMDFVGGSFSLPNNNLGLVAGGALTVNSAVSAKGISAVAPVIGGTGSLAATNDAIVIGTSAINIGSGISVQGANVFLGGGALNLMGANVTATAGNVEFNVANVVGTGGYISASHDIIGIVSGNIVLDGASHFTAGNDVNLSLTGGTSTISLSNGAYILATNPNTVSLAFSSRTSGGILIDGKETTKTVYPGSGFFVVDPMTPAAEGAGLHIVYASNGVTDLCALNPTLCKPADPGDRPGENGNLPKVDGGKTGDQTAGKGDSFGSDEGGKDKDDKDKDKDKDKSNQGKDGKKDEKPGKKQLAQCT